MQHFVAPACVVDCSGQVAQNPDYLLTVDDLLAFEAQHGRIPAGAWLLMRTDWSQRSDPEAYQNFDETGQHTPGPSTEAVRFLVDQRDVLGFGSEAIGTDAGQGYHLRPPTRATTTCMVRAAMGCNAWPIWTNCRPRAP